MYINYIKNHLFIHIPKTGGTSIGCSLDGYTIDGFHKSHVALKNIQDKIDISKFKIITFVRNPIDRFKSIYNFLLLKGIIHDTPITFATNIFLGKYDLTFTNPMCFFCRLHEVDELGRFENFENDFKRIFGVNYGPAKINVLLYKNDIYEDFPQLKDMVKRLYYEDFIEFKYDLEPFIYKTIEFNWSTEDFKETKSNCEKVSVKSGSITQWK